LPRPAGGLCHERTLACVQRLRPRIDIAALSRTLRRRGATPRSVCLRRPFKQPRPRSTTPRL
jgi:hypothetical protein